MVVQNWLLQSVSDIINQTITTESYSCSQAENSLQWRQAQLKAQKEWTAAVAATEKLLQQKKQGIILAGPAPIFSDSSLSSRLTTAIFSLEAFEELSLTPQLPPAEEVSCETVWNPIVQLPLLPNDPIAKEQFCLVLSDDLALVMVLGISTTGTPSFLFSFAPEIIAKTWAILRGRLILTNHQFLPQFDQFSQKFPLGIPDYHLVTEFTRQLLLNLPDFPQTQKNIVANDSKEIELLQAFTHEIRTPLTTIRTLTRLLLKRSHSFSADVLKRLETIDQECTEQINRMDLIFKAAELHNKSSQVQLTPISLEQIFEQNIPRWKKLAQRRNIVLEIILPNKLPQVVSDPTMLEQMLTGLIEKCTRNLSNGGEIHLEVMPVGNQLKLEVVIKSNYANNPFKALGQLLILQPETGNLSLNLDVTKNLFNLMGGKLTVKQKPQQGEVMTIFFPLNNSLNLRNGK